jgi:DNA-binding NarL/FixJ family response regulator
MHESEQMRKEAVRLGVHGYAAKSAPLSNILREIRSILGE